jgi:hypothetical protein
MQNKIDSNIRELIRLMLAEDAKQLVGDHLWPDDRRSTWRLDPPKIEKDTPREADLRKRIIGYIMNHKKKTVDQAAADDLLTIAADPTYKNTLPKYKKSQLYRGISVSGNWFKKNFDVTYEELLDDKPPGEKDDVVHTFERERVIRPKDIISSWSKLMTPAIDFAMGGGSSGSDFSVPIVYEADPAGGDFIDLKKVYDLGGDDIYDRGDSLWERRNEDEVVSIGPVKVSRIHVIGWRHRDQDRLRHDVYRPVGVGYDDVGEDESRRGLPGRLSVSRKYVDREFDKMGIPDIE